ncbi:phosphoribosylglycinamide formyltransferase [Roseibium album]|uniref:phosphoribosylglycinamide formyltransferase n=1 Tax=Roseibium album TaxID=311410 RepID=UPI00391ACE24
MIDLTNFPISDKDPDFYMSKFLLRKQFPEAEMIELAEGVITIVIGPVMTRITL